MTYRYLPIVLLTIVTSTTHAQNLNSAYFVDDYKYRHMMNPAFDNESSYFSFPALGNITINTKGNFGYNAVVLPNPLALQENQKSMTTFMNPYIDNSTALEGFSNGNNRIVGNITVALISVGFNGFGGYNTIDINSRSSFGLSIPYELFEFAKNTGNKTYEIGDISAEALSYFEIGLGHSHKVCDKLRLGAKMKILMGIGRADLRMENVKADLSDDNRWLVQGGAVIDVSMKNFNFKEEVKQYRNTNKGNYQRVNDVKIDKFGIDGLGMAFDLGGIFKANQDWTVSAALLDVGLIKWHNDIQAQNIYNQFEFDGFHDTSVRDDRPSEYGTLENQSDNYLDQIANFVNVQNRDDQGSRTTGIGATVNIGASYNLPSYRKLTLGVLSSTRINGDYSWTEARLSTNWSPLNWLNGGINIAISSFTTSFGWGLNIHPLGYNLFIGMDHTFGKLSKEGIPLNSNASASIGMNITW